MTVLDHVSFVPTKVGIDCFDTLSSRFTVRDVHAKVSYGKTREAILVETPPLRIPFGVVPFKIDGRPESFSVNLSLKGTDVEVETFRRKIKELDAIFEYKSKLFFGEEKSRTMTYIPLINSDTLRIRVPYDRSSQKFGCKFFDARRSEISFDAVTSQSFGVSLLELSNLWTYQNFFGLKFSLIRLDLVLPPGNETPVEDLIKFW